MIQYYENIPFCIMEQEEAGVNINFKEIIDYIEFMELKLKEIPLDSKVAYQQDDLSARFNKWNIFYAPEPCLIPVFKLIKTGWEQFKTEISFKEKPLWIHAHGNIHRKDQQLSYHAHRYSILGYVGLSSEGSNTTFYTHKDNDFGSLEQKVAIPIPNKNGQLVITLGPIPHHTDVWDKDYPRCSIAFNLLQTSDIKTVGAGPVFPFEL